MSNAAQFAPHQQLLRTQLPVASRMPALQMRPRHILVVDDEREIREVLSETLVDEGFIVASAADGAQALRAIERDRPDLVLLDMRMPVVNGWEFARLLRERDVQLPILVMTAAQNARSWAKEIGANGYLAKPFDLEVLLSTIEKTLA